MARLTATVHDSLSGLAKTIGCSFGGGEESFCWREFAASRTFRYVVVPLVAAPVVYAITAPIRRRISRRFYTYLMEEMSEVEAELNKDHLTELYGVMATVPPGGEDGALRVVELGAGTGIIFRFFPVQLRYSYYSVEPNVGSREMFDESVARYPNVTVAGHVDGGRLDDWKYFADGSVDVVVEKHVLCSVEEPQEILREIKRILKPGGKFIFFEHVMAERSSLLHRLQQICEPLWRYILECKLAFDAKDVINKAGFSRVDFHDYAAVLPNMWFIYRPHLSGYAEK